MLGVIENMSTHVCSTAATKKRSSGSGGGDAMSEDFDVDVLGQIAARCKDPGADRLRRPTVASDRSPAAEAYPIGGAAHGGALARQGRDYSAKFPKIVVEDS